MKKIVGIVVTLALVVVSVLSCNKNRFNYERLDTVEGSGQWKLPIGSTRATLGDVLKQFSGNETVTYDANGNLKIEKHYEMEEPIEGAEILTFKDTVFTEQFTLTDIISLELTEAIDTVISCTQQIVFNSEDIHVDFASICSGDLSIQVESNVGFLEASLSIPGLTSGNNNGLQTELDVTSGNITNIPLSGSLLQTMNDTLEIAYQIHCQIQEIEQSDVHIGASIGVHNLTFHELQGEINAQTIPFVIDNEFELPFNEIDGHLKLVDAQLQISNLNTFGVGAMLVIDTAMLYGEGASPSFIFDRPKVIEIVSQTNDEYTLAFDENITLDINTHYNAIYMSGNLIVNPEGFENPVHLIDTSKLAFAVDAVVPMKFNIPGVVYTDTLDVNVGNLEMPELIKEMILNVKFDSELPFNLDAQLYLFDSQSGTIIDHLFDESQQIAGSFNGVPVVSDIDLSITQQRLKNLMMADKIIMRIGIDTGNKDVMLNLEDALQMSIKADVIYGGELDVNQ